MEREYTQMPLEADSPPNIVDAELRGELGKIVG
jgi:hypothetical protein